MLASLISAAFLGGSCRRPFLVVAAALAPCLAFEDGDLDFKPLVLPWAISLMSRDRVMRPTLLASGIPGKGCGYWVRGRPPPHLRRRPRCCPHPTSCAPSARSSSSARYRTRLSSLDICLLSFLDLACAARSRYPPWPKSGRLVWRARIQRRQRARRHRIWMYRLPWEIPRL